MMHKVGLKPAFAKVKLMKFRTAKYLLLCSSGLSLPLAAFQVSPGCETYQAWTGQCNPRTDTTGLHNNNFPEAGSTTYWTTPLTAAAGPVVAIHGRYPRCRFISFQIYTGDLLVDVLSDADILQDPVENNPFVSGTEQGTYTAYLIFGNRPARPPPNTFYTGDLTSVSLSCRIYHATDPESLPGSTVDPILPDLWLNGQPLATCPVRPVIEPEDATVWGRLDNEDWHGTPAAGSSQLTAYDPPRWNIRDPYFNPFFSEWRQLLFRHDPKPTILISQYKQEPSRCPLQGPDLSEKAERGACLGGPPSAVLVALHR